MTLAELSGGPLVATEPAERATRQVRLQQAEADFDPLPLEVAAALHRAGRKTGVRSYDAMIAAVALANDLPLFMCNPANFEHIDGLDLRSVPHPDQPSGPSSGSSSSEPQVATDPAFRDTLR